MPRSEAIAASLLKLLDSSSRPTYVVDASRRIVYCNPALAGWIDLPTKRITGRRVEFHSEQPTSDDAVRTETAPLTDLCPPPHAFAGAGGVGTISCVGRDGRLRHRAADFVPLGREHKTRKSQNASAVDHHPVLVLLAIEDLSPQEVAAEISGDAATDELHRTIRRFRRSQAQRYSLKSLLGPSSAMQKVRAQIEAAAASGANTLIYGRPGSGRSHVALAILYHKPADDAKLARINCETVTETQLAQTIDRIQNWSATSSRPGSTLLLENLERLSAVHQTVLSQAIEQHKLNVRLIATLNAEFAPTAVHEDLSPTNDAAQPTDAQNNPPTVLPSLINAISTITIHVPRLVDRLEDLPVLAQYFLESCNRGSSHQVGSVRSEVLDALALYSWPGELVQLQQVIEAAHANCTTHELKSSDLPSTFFHAFSAASRTRRPSERINLDDLLAGIEKEAITRALAQAGGNKSEAAILLGMTRPRLYRRLIQLGFITEAAGDEEPEAPEFIEQDL
jgi:DNA-binding NtrC family response regulator